MKLFEKKAILLKSAVAVAAVVISAINFSQANGKVKSTSLATITEAKAGDMVCPSLLNSWCWGYTDDNVYHEVSNAENQ